MLTDSGTSFVVTYDSTSGRESTRAGRAVTPATRPSRRRLLSSGAAVRQPVVQPPQVVVFGVTPVPQHKSFAFGVPGGPLGS